MSFGRSPLEALDADLRRRLAIPLNPLAMLVNGLAWRAVLYCFTSILVGLVALLVGVAGFLALPWVSRLTTRLECERVSILALPRLVMADPDAGEDASPAGRWNSVSTVGVWGVSVLFGLVDAIVGAVLAVLLLAQFFYLVNPAGEGGVVLAVMVALFGGTLTAALYIGWGLAASQTYAIHALLRRQLDLTDRVTALTVSRSELVDAFEAERRRIERDLHDGAQQHLVVSTMRLGEAVYWLDQQQTPQARTAVLAAQQSIEDALAALRTTIRGIHPQVLTDCGLPAALRELAARQPLPVAVRIEGSPRPLSPGLENAAYHVATEALTNVAKHARATQATLTLEFSDRLVLKLADDGQGGARSVPGHGLSGLAERVATAGGTFEVASPDGGPTLVAASFPAG